jgi:glycine/D-amino acid oxidase-like deaminating enzyme
MPGQFLEMTSVWASGAHAPTYPPLDGDRHVDVVIVGGGITGATAGYLLKQAGRTVAIVEQRRCGGGETGRSSGHLTAVTDAPLATLIQRLGRDRARAVWDAGFAALARVRATVRDERIHCGFSWVPAWLHAPADADPWQARQDLSREARAVADLGIDGLLVDDVPGLGGPALRFESQARLHPLQYLEVLLARVHGDGCHVFEDTPVDTIEARPWAVRAGAHRITAEYIVVATHHPTILGLTGDDALASSLHLKRTYAVSGIAPRADLAEGLYWEHRTDAPEYLRIDRRETHDQVILGGQDHPSTPDDQSLEARDRLLTLERRLRERIPDVRITRRWSGHVVETDDGMPIIGELSPGRFAATGFGGNGLTFGTLAGMMAADAAMGHPNPWAQLFGPRRGGLPGGTPIVPIGRLRVAPFRSGSGDTGPVSDAAASTSAAPAGLGDADDWRAMATRARHGTASAERARRKPRAPSRPVGRTSAGGSDRLEPGDGTDARAIVDVRVLPVGGGRGGGWLRAVGRDGEPVAGRRQAPRTRPRRHRRSRDAASDARHHARRARVRRSPGGLLGDGRGQRDRRGPVVSGARGGHRS